MFGRMMFEVATGHLAEKDFGVSKYTIDRFYDAFLQALSPDLETGGHVGEAAYRAAKAMNVGGIEYSRIGFKDGIPVYRSSLPTDWSYREKQNYVLHLVQEVWSLKPIELYIERNGKKEKITARFDPMVADRSDATKIAYGNRHGTMRDQKTTIDLGPDLYEIAEQSEYTAQRRRRAKIIRHMRT